MPPKLIKTIESMLVVLAHILRVCVPNKVIIRLVYLIGKIFSYRVLYTLSERFFPIMLRGVSTSVRTKSIAREIDIPAQFEFDLSDYGECKYWLYPENYLVNFLATELDAGSVLIDIGANIGYHSILAALQTRPSQIICIEPHPGTFARLQRNIQLNGIRAHLLNIALNDKNEILELHEYPGSRGGSSVDGENLKRRKLESYEVKILRNKKILKVPSFSFDYLVDTDLAFRSILNARKIIVKMDTEGHESKIFHGMTRFLDSYRGKLTIISEAYRYDQAQLEAFMQLRGFKKYFVNSNGGLSDTIVNPDALYDDLIFIRN